MPKSQKTKLEKVIHPYSRKALQVERRYSHDKRLSKARKERSSKLDILAEKLKWFHDHLDDREVYTKSELFDMVENFRKRFDEELQQISIVHSVGTRKSKQYAPREAAIQITKEMENNEFESVGIEVPDFLNKANLLAFRNWNGEMKYVQNFKLRKISTNDRQKMEATENGVTKIDS